MKLFKISILLLMIMTILTGFIYPLIIWVYAQMINPELANGSLIFKNNFVIGSELLAQEFQYPYYFKSRPSAVNFNAASSGASNLSPSRLLLLTNTQNEMKNSDPLQVHLVPQDFIFASASGLDPHITVKNVEFQAPQVAIARSISLDKIQKLILAYTENAQFGFFGEPRINVLKLNLALDKMN